MGSFGHVPLCSVTGVNELACMWTALTDSQTCSGTASFRHGEEGDPSGGPYGRLVDVGLTHCTMQCFLTLRTGP